MEIQHHEKYEEIHGEDKIVMMNLSEHKLLHNRLRKEGKCNIPADELNKISTAAHHRSPNGKAARANYKKSRQTKHQLTTLNIEKNLHKRTKLWCAKNETNINDLMVKLLSKHMYKKKVK